MMCQIGLRIRNTHTPQSLPYDPDLYEDSFITNFERDTELMKHPGTLMFVLKSLDPPGPVLY